MRRRSAATLIALALGPALFAGCGGDSDEGDAGGDTESGITAERASGPLPTSGDLLFVLRGPASLTEGAIEIETDTVEWFTDRPKRRAGVAQVRGLVEGWEGYGFAATPPNAALAGAEVDAEVELTEPELTSDGIGFDFAPLRGEIDQGEAGELSVFIDASANRCYIDVTNDTSYSWTLEGYGPGADDWSEGDPGGGPDATIAPRGSMGSAFNDDEGVIDYKDAGGDGSTLGVGTDCKSEDGETRAVSLYCAIDGPAGAEIGCSKKNPGRHAVFTLETK